MGEIIYDSTRESLFNSLFRLQRLQEEGVNVGNLADQTWEQVLDLVERSDEQKLTELRKELKDVRRDSH